MSEVVIFTYKNYRGETARRRVIPVSLRCGSDEFHQGDQWILEAYDLDRQARRSFVMADIQGWRPEDESDSTEPNHLEWKYKGGYWEAILGGHDKGVLFTLDVTPLDQRGSFRLLVGLRGQFHPEDIPERWYHSKVVAMVEAEAIAGKIMRGGIKPSATMELC